MAYAIESDLDTKWGSDQVTLAALDPATGLRSETRVAAALDDASAQMDGYFAKRYTLPIDAASNGVILLRNLCCDLAMGNLAIMPGARNDIVKAANEQAIRFLERVGSGSADIPQNPPPSGPAGVLSPNEAIVADDPRMFTRRRLREL